MNVSQAGIDLIKKYEGCKLTAYKDSVGIWTIGYGNTYYENGIAVKEGDRIIQENAEKLIKVILKKFEDGVSRYVTSNITQNQFDALCCFSYNVGLNAFKNSTLLKKINKDPNDPTIRDEFKKWNKAGGVVLRGLTNRRASEAFLYIKK